MKRTFTSVAAVMTVVFTASASENMPVMQTQARYELSQTAVVSPGEITGNLTEMLRRNGMNVRAREAASETIIREAPEGTRLECSAAGFGYSLSFYGINFSYMSGLSKEVVRTDDALYIRDPFLAFYTNSYLKADLKDGKYTAQLPLLIYEEEAWGTTVSYYAHILKKQITDDGYISFVPSDITEVSFVEKDGAIVLDLEYDPVPDENGYIDSPDYIFGIADSDGVWAGVGDATQRYTVFEDSLMTPPSSLETQRWTLVEGSNGRFLNVGFDGSDVWIQGMFRALPETWIKGSVSENEVIFPSFQYLGMSSGYYSYLVNVFFHDDGSASPLVELVMDYDSEKHRISPRNQGDAMMMNAGKETLAYLEYVKAPELHLQPADISQQVCNPYDLVFNDYYSSMGMSFFDFTLPLLNPDNDLLDPANMYYNIYFDGELMTFYNDEYPEDVEDEITDIPFLFGRRNFWNDGKGKTEIVIFADGLESLGVQLFNKVDGVVYKSDIVTLLTAVSVDSNVAESEIESEVWYDLSGRIVENPLRGLFIKKTVLKNGTVKVAKSMLN